MPSNGVTAETTLQSVPWWQVIDSYRGDEERLWRDAEWAAQGCNPVGLTRTLASIMLYWSFTGLDHDAILRHPTVVVLLDQIYTLANRAEMPHPYTHYIDAVGAWGKIREHKEALATSPDAALA